MYDDFYCPFTAEEKREPSSRERSLNQPSSVHSKRDPSHHSPSPETTRPKDGYGSPLNSAALITLDSNSDIDKLVASREYNRSQSLISLVSDYSEVEDNEFVDLDEILEIFRRYDEEKTGYLDKTAFFQSLQDLAQMNPGLGAVLGKKEDLFSELNHNGLLEYRQILQVLEEFKRMQELEGDYPDEMSSDYYSDDVFVEEQEAEISFREEVLADFNELEECGYINKDDFLKLAEKYHVHSKYLALDYFYQQDERNKGYLSFDQVFEILDNVKKQSPFNGYSLFDLDLPDAISFHNADNVIQLLPHIKTQAVTKQILMDMAQLITDAKDIREKSDLQDQMHDLRSEMQHMQKEKGEMERKLEITKASHYNLVYQLEEEKERALREEKHRVLLLQQEKDQYHLELRQTRQRLGQATLQNKQLQQEVLNKTYKAQEDMYELETTAAALEKRLRDSRMEEHRLVIEKERMESNFRRTVNELNNHKAELAQMTKRQSQRNTESFLLIREVEELADLPPDYDRKEEESLQDIYDNGHTFAIPDTMETDESSAQRLTHRLTLFNEMDGFDEDSDTEEYSNSVRASYSFSNLPPSRWSTEEVEKWLHHLSMPQHQMKFAEAGINGKKLLELNETILLELGVAQDDISRLAEEIRELTVRNEHMEDRDTHKALIKAEEEEREAVRNYIEETMSGMITFITAHKPKVQRESHFFCRPLGFSVIECTGDENAVNAGLTEVDDVTTAIYSVRPGSVISKINGNPMYTKDYEDVQTLLETLPTPIQIVFARPPMNKLQARMLSEQENNAAMRYQQEVSHVKKKKKKKKKRNPIHAVQKGKCVIS